MSDLEVITIPQLDYRLGRQVVHDERSRAFPMKGVVDQSTWRTRMIRIYDPGPNPKQTVGNCTGCQKAMSFNAVGTRTPRVVHGMDFADTVYRMASAIDPWPGQWPPQDTGSSGLAAADAARQLGVGGEFRWIFDRADGVVQAIMEGWTVGVGTWWYEGGFNPLSDGRIEMTGKRIGGHQWTVRGYNEPRDSVIGRCWWGGFRDFYLKREHLDDLLADNGDANVQEKAL